MIDRSCMHTGYGYDTGIYGTPARTDTGMCDHRHVRLIRMCIDTDMIRHMYV